MSGATNNEVGAPETRIMVLIELVLTPRDDTSTPVLGPVVTAQSKLTPQSVGINPWEAGELPCGTASKNSEINSPELLGR